MLPGGNQEEANKRDRDHRIKPSRGDAVVLKFAVQYSRLAIALVWKYGQSHYLLTGIMVAFPVSASNNYGTSNIIQVLYSSYPCISIGPSAPALLIRTTQIRENLSSTLVKQRRDKYLLLRSFLGPDEPFHTVLYCWTRLCFTSVVSAMPSRETLPVISALA